MLFSFSQTPWSYKALFVEHLLRGGAVLPAEQLWEEEQFLSFHMEIKVSCLRPVCS